MRLRDNRDGNPMVDGGYPHPRDGPDAHLPLPIDQDASRILN